MRTSWSVLAISAAALLAACGKSQAPSSAPAVSEASSAASAPSEAAPAEPTADQAKAILATLPAPYNTADLDNGKHKLAQCRSCHTTAQGGPAMTGPNLWGVFGRKAGTVEGFAYSDPLKATAITWDTAKLDAWITDPRAMVPGTKMSFFGVKDAKDRVDVIAYLKVETTAPSK
jgi:cytochrome c